MYIAIVGSGPSGLYTAELLLKQYEDCHVHIFEELPVPFGLLRYGVAPDHLKIKSLDAYFDSILSHPNCEFIGNCSIGDDISMNQLKSHYDAVVIATGAQDSKRPAIPGSNLKGVFTASEIAAWYNGLPGATCPFDRTEYDSFLVVGCGNVSLDIIRVLGASYDQLKSVDIPSHVLDTLSNLVIKQFTVVGRRGPFQVTFTPKELRDLLESSYEFRYLDSDYVSYLSRFTLLGLTFSKRQELLAEIYNTFSNSTQRSNLKQQVNFTFFKSITQYFGESYLEGAEFQETQLKGGEDIEHIHYLDTKTSINCDACCLSIGYQPIQLAGLHYLPSGALNNANGQVLDHDNQVEDGVFVVGWSKRGAVGVIGSNRSCAKETVQSLTDYIKTRKCGTDNPLETLVNNNTVVFYNDWKELDRYEREMGVKLGKVREKLCSKKDMLNFLKKE